MPQTAIPTAAGETAGSGRAPHYLLAYLDEGRVRVYASGKPGLWVGRQLPGADEMISFHNPVPQKYPPCSFNPPATFQGQTILTYPLREGRRPRSLLRGL